MMNESSPCQGHFGAGDHGYAHWLGLDLPGGMLQLSQLLFLCPEAAAAAKRDETVEVDLLAQLQVGPRA